MARAPGRLGRPAAKCVAPPRKRLWKLGASWGARRGFSPPPRRARRPGAARGPFVSPARAPPGEAGSRPASRAGEEGARAVSTPPGAARAGPHLPGPRGALRSAPARSPPAEAVLGPGGPRPAGRHGAGTFGPEAGLAAQCRELLPDPVSDGRAAGLRAPGTDLNCRESSEPGAGRPGLWRYPFHLRCCRFPNGLTPARCLDDPSGRWGPKQ